MSSGKTFPRPQNAVLRRGAVSVLRYDGSGQLGMSRRGILFKG